MADPEGAAPGLRERTRSSVLGNVVVLAVVTVLILAVAWAMGRSGTGDSSTVVDVPAATGPAPSVGDPGPNFTAMTTAGEPVALSGLLGRPVWLSFVATWCGSCRSEAVDVEAAWVAGGGGVEVISIYLGENAATVEAYADRLAMTHPQIPDLDKEIASRYRVMSVPTHVFLDSRGRIHSTHIGVMSRAAMDERIREVAGSTGE